MSAAVLRLGDRGQAVKRKARPGNNTAVCCGA